MPVPLCSILSGNKHYLERRSLSPSVGPATCTFRTIFAHTSASLCQETREEKDGWGIHIGGRTTTAGLPPTGSSGKKRSRTGQRGEGVEVAKQGYEEKYTRPELRKRIKEEIKASDKGGKEGQWSARKSQLLTQEYEKQGGGYKSEKDQSQRNLEKWTEEDWQTKEGDADARQYGETKRYLPKKAWENMSEEEKEETERSKREGSKKGRQYVSNTDEAKQSRKEAAALPLKNYDDLGVEQVEKKAKDLSKDEIRDLLDYEKQHKNRETLVEALDRKL
jgi:hypothetical protein